MMYVVSVFALLFLLTLHTQASTVGVTRTSASTLASTHATTNAIDISGGTDASAHDQKTKATKATKTEKPTKTKAADGMLFVTRPLFDAVLTYAC